MRRRTTLLAVSCSLAIAAAGVTGPAVGTPPGAAQDPGPPKTPIAVGKGGAVSSVDPNASRIGLRVLKNGGNAVDAAVATAAALGVAEPYSAGVGGGGYFVYYNARSGKVRTIDGRETAPDAMPTDAFIDPETGEPYPFTPDLVTSGVSVGVPGTPATWTTALERWGTKRLRTVLEPVRPAGRARLRGRRDVPRADRGQRGPVRGVHLDQAPVPQGRVARGRLALQESGARPHLPRLRQEPAALLPGPAPRRDRRRGPHTRPSPTTPRCRCRRAS